MQTLQKVILYIQTECPRSVGMSCDCAVATAGSSVAACTVMASWRLQRDSAAIAWPHRVTGVVMVYNIFNYVHTGNACVHALYMYGVVAFIEYC